MLNMNLNAILRCNNNGLRPINAISLARVKLLSFVLCAIAQLASSSNDTLNICTKIQKNKTFGYFVTSKNQAQIMLSIQMNWSDSLLPACGIQNYYKFGHKTTFDTTIDITLMPDHADEMGSLASKMVSISGCAKDLMVIGKDGKSVGFGYSENIVIHPSKTKQVLIEFDGDFHPWGKGIQKYNGKILTSKDTTISYKLESGILNVKFTYIK
jgi:hypothetical protein